jgi:hypothetical protein
MRKPAALCRDERISDAEIARHYRAQDIVEIDGQAGTVFAADTRGFHKGTFPKSGDRLVIQIEYANSLFGAPFNSGFNTQSWSAATKSELQQFSYTFQRFRG